MSGNNVTSKGYDAERDLAHTAMAMGGEQPIPLPNVVAFRDGTPERCHVGVRQGYHSGNWFLYLCRPTRLIF